MSAQMIKALENNPDRYWFFSEEVLRKLGRTTLLTRYDLPCPKCVGMDAERSPWSIYQVYDKAVSVRCQFFLQPCNDYQISIRWEYRYLYNGSMLDGNSQMNFHPGSKITLVDYMRMIRPFLGIYDSEYPMDREWREEALCTLFDYMYDIRDGLVKVRRKR